ncbi:MAG: hypothetical protein FD134_1539 [Gallionellaceae bacterium]|nr:MAG: hypothetical protein FD134_1539 [Gallionellaceae bacterium]
MGREEEAAAKMRQLFWQPKTENFYRGKIMDRQAILKWLTVMLAILAASSAWADPKLAGQWALNGQPYLVLNKDGTGTLEGDAFTWQARGNTLVLSASGQSNTLPYQINGSSLTLQLGFIPISLQRMGDSTGGAGRSKASGEPATTAKGAPDQLSQLLLSSAWCSFKYNQYTGTSNTTRYQFFGNGTYSNSGRGETYNSGRYGTVAGQHDSGGSGRWAVRDGLLYFSSPPEQPDLQPARVTVTRNSSGYPIINADGVEYSMCQ